MKYKVGQRLKIREDHYGIIPDMIVSGHMDSRFYEWMISNVLSVRNVAIDKKHGNLYEFELPEGVTCWVKEEAVRGLKSKKQKDRKALGEVEQLDKIALNFREG